MYTLQCTSAGGSDTESVTITVTTPTAPPAGIVSPSPVDFGSVNRGSSPSSLLVSLNDRAVQPTATMVSGPFTVSAVMSYVGSGTTFAVAPTAQAATSLGTVSGSFRLDYSDGNTWHHYIVPITMNVSAPTAANFSLSSTALDFGTIAVGSESKHLQPSVLNYCANGCAPLTWTATVTSGPYYICPSWSPCTGTSLTRTTPANNASSLDIYTNTAGPERSAPGVITITANGQTQTIQLSMSLTGGALSVPTPCVPRWPTVTNPVTGVVNSSVGPFVLTSENCMKQTGTGAPAVSFQIDWDYLYGEGNYTETTADGIPSTTAAYPGYRSSVDHTWTTKGSKTVMIRARSRGGDGAWYYSSPSFYTVTIGDAVAAAPSASVQLAQMIATLQGLYEQLERLRR